MRYRLLPILLGLVFYNHGLAEATASPDRWIAILSPEELDLYRSSGSVPASLRESSDERVIGRTANEIVPTDFETQPSVTSSTVGAGRRTVSFLVVCMEGLQLIPNVDVELSFRTITQSGGHAHDAPSDLLRPQGSLAPLSGNTGPDGTLVRAEFEAPEPSGVSRVTITCFGGPPTSRVFTIGVRVRGLVGLAGDASYQLIGATGQHPDNHFGTPALNEAILTLAQSYARAFPESPRLRINDQSLVEGGLFDISGMWSRPHGSHRFGTDVDVGLVPPANAAQFVVLAQTAGFGVVIAEGDHYHLRL